MFAFTLPSNLQTCLSCYKKENGRKNTVKRKNIYIKIHFKIRNTKNTFNNEVEQSNYFQCYILERKPKTA